MRRRTGSLALRDVTASPQKRIGLSAGVDVEAALARVALVASDDERRRHVRVVEREPISDRAIVRGLVRDPEAVERAVRAALARAEERADHRADRLVVATSVDDLRVHRHVWRATRSGDGAVSGAEARRAGERATRTAAREAIAAVSDEPALRRSALVQLQPLAARVTVDGKPFVAPGRQRGEVLEVDVVVPVLPLSQSSGLEAAIAPLGRNTRYVASPVVFGALLAESGIEDVVAVWLGREVTGVCVVRDGAPVGARSFSIGAGSFDPRPAGEAAHDAAVWARCVALAASDAVGDRDLPAQALVAADPARADALATALQGALSLRQRTGGTRSEPLTQTQLRNLDADFALEIADLVAVAAASAA